MKNYLHFVYCGNSMKLLFWLCQYELPRLIAVEGFPPRLFFCLSPGNAKRPAEPGVGHEQALVGRAASVWDVIWVDAGLLLRSHAQLAANTAYVAVHVRSAAMALSVPDHFAETIHHRVLSQMFAAVAQR